MADTIVEREHYDLWLDKILLMTLNLGIESSVHLAGHIFLKHQFPFLSTLSPPRQLSAACSCRVTIDPYWPILHCALHYTVLCSVLHCALYNVLHCALYCTVHCTL